MKTFSLESVFVESPGITSMWWSIFKLVASMSLCKIAHKSGILHCVQASCNVAPGPRRGVRFVANSGFNSYDASYCNFILEPGWYSSVVAYFKIFPALYTIESWKLLPISWACPTGHGICLNVCHQAILKPETKKNPALFPVWMILDSFGLVYPCTSDISPPKKYNSKQMAVCPSGSKPTVLSCWWRHHPSPSIKASGSHVFKRFQKG